MCDTTITELHSLPLRLLVGHEKTWKLYPGSLSPASTNITSTTEHTSAINFTQYPVCIQTIHKSALSSPNLFLCAYLYTELFTLQWWCSSGSPQTPRTHSSLPARLVYSWLKQLNKICFQNISLNWESFHQFSGWQTCVLHCFPYSCWEQSQMMNSNITDVYKHFSGKWWFRDVAETHTLQSCNIPGFKKSTTYLKATTRSLWSK